MPVPKKINLLPYKEFENTPFGKFLLWALSYGRYIIISTEIIVLLAFIARFGLDRKITDLNDEITQKSTIVEANLGFEDQFRNLQQRTQHIGNLFLHQNQVVQILRHLETITPSGIKFSALSFTSDGLFITATAQTSASLSVLIDQLNNSSLLTDINITSVSKRDIKTGEISLQIQAQPQFN